jgi:hypothetical protein
MAAAETRIGTRDLTADVAFLTCALKAPTPAPVGRGWPSGPGLEFNFDHARGLKRDTVAHFRPSLTGGGGSRLELSDRALAE